MSTEFIAELERRVIAVQNEIAHLEDLRFPSVIEQQRLDLLRNKLRNVNAALDREVQQIPLITEGM